MSVATLANYWPDDIPLPLIDFQGAPRNTTINTPMGNFGKVLRRQRFYRSYYQLQVRWVLDAAQRDAFQSFWTNDLGMGMSRFGILLRFPKRDELTEWEVRFLGKYDSNYDDGFWIITSTIDLFQPTGRVLGDSTIIVSEDNYPDRYPGDRARHVVGFLDGEHVFVYVPPDIIPDYGAASATHLSGTYNEVVVSTSADDAGGGSATFLSGTYFDVIVPQSVDDDGSGNAAFLSGTYFEVIVPTTIGPEAVSNRVTFSSGSYVETVVPETYPSEASSMSAGFLSGSYTAV